MRREIIPVIGGLELTKVRPGHIRAVLAGVQKRGLSAATAPRFAVCSVQPCARRSPTGSSPLTNIRAAGIRAGQDVLVYGATGAIGTAAVQLLKHLGAKVTAVCTTEHVDLVRGLGADRVIDRTTEDFTKDEQTYDVVFARWARARSDDAGGC
jgi:NADPH:quinone reductase-like Zn-dependent oxidoreductase